MIARVLLLACLMTFGYSVADAQSQAPSPGTNAATSNTAQTKQQIKAAKKAERIAIRKKRAQCYDQAKKEKKTGPELVSFLDACNKK